MRFAWLVILGSVLWSSTALSNCGTAECTTANVPEMPEAMAAWSDLEKTMAGQRKLALWLDSKANPGLEHALVLQNNHASFETFILSFCGEKEVSEQEACYVEKIRERINALENPDGENYIWLP